MQSIRKPLPYLDKLTEFFNQHGRQPTAAEMETLFDRPLAGFTNAASTTPAGETLTGRMFRQRREAFATQAAAVAAKRQAPSAIGQDLDESRV